MPIKTVLSGTWRKQQQAGRTRPVGVLAECQISTMTSLSVQVGSPPTKLQEGNIFRLVCLSVCSRGSGGVVVLNWSYISADQHFPKVCILSELYFLTGTTARAGIESCSASSEFSSDYLCHRVDDGNINSYWATRGEGVGSWIQVSSLLRRLAPISCHKSVLSNFAVLCSDVVHHKPMLFNR